MDLITIQISAKTYSGFKYPIPREYLKNTSDEDLIKEVKQFMKNFFKLHNLYLLEHDVDDLKLHFHESKDTDKDIIYLCDHEH